MYPLHFLLSPIALVKDNGAWEISEFENLNELNFMRTPIRNSTKRLWLTYPILLAALIWTAGCATQTPDPVAGWHLCFDQDPKNLGNEIMADYQDYMQKLPPKKRERVSFVNTLEDGNGQHAIVVEMWVTGNTSWHYALIYDKDNKRIKVVKYGYSRTMS